MSVRWMETAFDSSGISVADCGAAESLQFKTLVLQPNWPEQGKPVLEIIELESVRD